MHNCTHNNIFTDARTGRTHIRLHRVPLVSIDCDNIFICLMSGNAITFLSGCVFVYTSVSVYTHMCHTYNEVSERRPLKASAAMSEIWFLLKSLGRKSGRDITLIHSNGVHFCANVLELHEKMIMRKYIGRGHGKGTRVRKYKRRLNV